jgi:hypothetical protein
VSALAPFILAGLATSIGFQGGLVVCTGFFALAAVVTMLLPRTGNVTDDITAQPTPDPRDDASATV